MDRSRIHELHYITDLANIASILDLGILSCREVSRRGIPHVTIANKDLRDQQRAKRVWDARTGRARSLLEYTNLYFDARNAMLFERLVNQQGDLAVIAVAAAVLDLDGVLVADRNAAAFATFQPPEEAIPRLDAKAVFARSWDSWDAKQRRQAEVLVPTQVPPEFLLRAYLPDPAAKHRLRSLLGDRQLKLLVNRDLFFSLGES